jgi:hypothetical protein
VDVYFTKNGDSNIDTFFSTDVMNSWELMPDRYANIKLELYTGTEWVEYPNKGTAYAQDESMVLGNFVSNSTIYNTCRNFNLTEIHKYTQARLSVNMHIGTDLLDVPEPDPEDEGDVASPLDTTKPLLKVKLNGAVWERYDLTSNLGKDNIWVTVPLNFGKIRSGRNILTVDTNIENTGNYCDNSVDLYFTDSASCSGEDQISTDKMVNWVNYQDRYANMYFELHNTATGKWEKVTPNETYKLYEHTVVGYFNPGKDPSPFNMRRYINIEDINGYDSVRAVLNLHVGSKLSLKK